MMRRTMTRAAYAAAILAVVWPRVGLAWWWSKTIKIWEDDAKTRKIEVKKLNPDEIAKRYKSLPLGASWSVAGVGVGVKWSKESGVKYDQEVQQLIQKLKDLAKEFNKGKLTLETYRRRLRAIYAAEEKAQAARNALYLAMKQEAQRAFRELNRMVGRSSAHIKQCRVTVEGAMKAFADAATAVKVEARGVGPMPELQDLPPQAAWEQIRAETRRAAERKLEELHKAVASADEPRRREMIRVWRDDAHTRRVVAPKLDVDRGVKDLTDSLSLGASFYGFNIGPQAKWTLRTAEKYDQDTQMIILKYRQLCMEYNADLVSQESYLRRLRELYEAEDLAQSARHEMFLLMRKQAQQGFKELAKVLKEKGIGDFGQAEADKTAGALDKIADEMSKKAWKDDKPKKSLVDKMAAENARLIGKTLTELEAKAKGIKIAEPKDTVEVWVTDAKRRKVKAPKLDVNLIAQNVKRVLSFRITYYGFGPQLTWARNRGLEYDHYAQMLIVKAKQLAMDYNAGLVSQESYQRRRREIDAAIERARKVREQMFVFLRMLSKEGFDELDAEVKTF